VSELLLILVSTSVANNLVLNYMLGIDPLLATSQKTGPAINTCLFMVFTMPVVSVISYTFNIYIFEQYVPDYLHLISTVIIIAVTVMVTGLIIQRLSPNIYIRIEKIIPLMMVNSTLLGLVLIEKKYVYSMISALFSGLGTALGFCLILMMFVSIRKKLDNPEIPIPFQGIAIIFITLGILSLGFMGFSGISSP
jgi:Na+-translocating ferredoxin:NAD+ oxidoreductase subunit A